MFLDAAELCLITLPPRSRWPATPCEALHLRGGGMARLILPLLVLPGMEIRKAVFSSDGKSITPAYTGISHSFRCASTVTRSITQETQTSQGWALHCWWVRGSWNIQDKSFVLCRMHGGTRTITVYKWINLRIIIFTFTHFFSPLYLRNKIFPFCLKDSLFLLGSKTPCN